MMEVSVREAGRYFGVSHVALLKAVKNGSFPVDADGKVNLQAARESEWAKNRGGALPPLPVENSSATQPKAASAARHHLAPVVSSTVVVDGLSKVELEKLLLVERREKIKLENARRRGELVDRAEVESATEARFRADAEALLSWPSRVNAEMAADLGMDELKLHTVLDKYVREFMAERSREPLRPAA